MADIFFPSSCAPENIFYFCSSIENFFHEENINIDFSRMGRVEPFSMIYVAKHIRDFNRKRIRHNELYRISCSGHTAKDYAANMAFFRAFGLRHGREPGCTDGNSNFVPFTILRVQTILDEAASAYVQEQEIVERRAADLAMILSRQTEGDLVDALTFSIREIMRNVIEHSGSKAIEYCAQYWPSYNKVEITISDNGMGMRQSLSRNPFISAKSDSEAIQLALMPSISGKSFKGVRIDRDNPWHNSGFGLYMISRICKLGGSFLICSGDHAIHLDDSGKQHMNLGHYHEGTVVRMVLNTSKLGALSSMLSQFRDDGYKIAAEIKSQGVYTASAASLMLSRDFK
ncbi:ATP-binding protein [Serratia quinivorans]|uniref:ATP-binding protein n=1 Tax=Serratia quinivorans TaxID=137545 RepID=UPI00217C5DA7|nr:ATP-binding protein [Serratia quinivorans]CAI2069066.1 Histidine kinase-, DNA gyrase B-, and HSP90-like ATPase [Serratia quinivorans]